MGRDRKVEVVCYAVTSGLQLHKVTCVSYSSFITTSNTRGKHYRRTYFVRIIRPNQTISIT